MAAQTFARVVRGSRQMPPNVKGCPIVAGKSAGAFETGSLLEKASVFKPLAFSQVAPAYGLYSGAASQ